MLDDDAKVGDLVTHRLHPGWIFRIEAFSANPKHVWIERRHEDNQEVEQLRVNWPQARWRAFRRNCTLLDLDGYEGILEGEDPGL